MHGRDATEVHASDLTLDKFLDAATLAAAPSLPGPSAEVRTVLLTGATGFLGRYLALEWLERMDLVDGKVICLVRAKDDADCPRSAWTRRSTAAIPKLLRALPRTGRRPSRGHRRRQGRGRTSAWTTQTWQRLADTVDLIVDPAALVNHVLPYSQLFGPNALGTAELIRIALTTKHQAVHLRVDDRCGRPDRAGEVHRGRRHPGDQRRPARSTTATPTATATASGPARCCCARRTTCAACRSSVFRCDMILADTTYAGQLNVPDMFTRMMLSLVATGIAPGLVLRARRRRQPAAGPLRRAARRVHRRGDLHPGRTAWSTGSRPTT